MLCIHCERETSSEEACDACGEDPLVAGEYRVLEVLGRGANATTYRAQRLDDEEVVALKELLVRNAESLKTLELFEREARTLEQLDHRGIPNYYDDLTVELGPNVGMYIAQEFVSGTSLAEKMKEGPLDPLRVLRVMRGVAEVLDYLDDLNPPVVHRDIKPANIIDRGGQNIALIDFGSVRDVAGDPTTGVPTMAGTLGYMAPEQLMGRSTPASDVYALAVTAVALFTGKPPSEDTLESDWSWSRELPDEVRQLLKRMLATRPSNRPSADELLEDVTRVVAAFEKQREIEERRSQALARVPSTPRSLPGNFDHQFAFGRPLAAMIVGVTVLFVFVMMAGGLGNLGLLFLLAGLGLAVVPIARDRKEARRVKLFSEGEVVVGTVDGVVTHTNAEAVLHYSFTVGDETYRETWSSAMMELPMNAGEDLLVFYEAGNPSRNKPLPEFLVQAPRLM